MSLDYAKFSTGLGFSNGNLRPYAESAHGAAFLEKYLHPPGPPLESINGIPDKDSMSSALVEYRLPDTIGPPTFTTQKTWDCLIVTLPNMRYHSVVFKWLTGSAFPTAQVITNDEFVFNDANIRQTMSRIRAVARSTTFYFNAPSLSDQGMVYAAQTRSTNSTTTPNATPATGTTFPYCIADLGRLSQEPDFLTMMSNKSYMGPAKGAARDKEGGGGVYLPHGFSQPTQPYLPAYGTQISSTGQEQARAFITHVHYTDPAGVSVSVSLGESPPFMDMSYGYTMFKGISVDATISVKTWMDFEVIVAPRGLWTPFITSGAEPDEKAMESAYRIKYHMSDAYPGSHNFLGALGGLLSTLAPAIPGIITGIGSLFNKPAPPTPAAAPVAAPRRINVVAPTPAPRRPRPAPRPSLQRPVPAPRPTDAQLLAHYRQQAVRNQRRGRRSRRRRG